MMRSPSIASEMQEARLLAVSGKKQHQYHTTQEHAHVRVHVIDTVIVCNVLGSCFDWHSCWAVITDHLESVLALSCQATHKGRGHSCVNTVELWDVTCLIMASPGE